MKKKFLIPCLFMASSLTACDSGLVTSGVAYKEGDAAKVSESLKTEKQDNVKVLKVKSSVEATITAEANGEKEKATSSVNTTENYNFDDKTIEIDYTAKSKSKSDSKTYKASIKAKDSNGNMNVVDKSGDYSMVINELDFNSLMIEAKTSIYSWNFTYDAGAFNSAIGEIGASAGSLAKDIQNNIVYNGDLEKGTFDIGLGKQVSGKISVSGESGLGSLSMNFTITKMKNSYKDGLIKSSIIGMKADYSQVILGTTLNMTYDILAKNDYSYTMK